MHLPLTYRALPIQTTVERRVTLAHPEPHGNQQEPSPLDISDSFCCQSSNISRLPTESREW